MFSSVNAGGLDATFLHGSRNNAMGGHHVALTGDAFGPYLNPGNMTALDRPMVALSNTNLLFQNEAPIGSANAQRKSVMGFGPYFYTGGVYPLNDRIAFGLAVFTTQSQGGTFKGVDYGPVMTDKEYSNLLFRIEISPAVAVKLEDHFSVGAAWKIGYTRYDKKVGTFNGVNSVFMDSSVTNWDAKGLKLGALFDSLKGLKIGLTYRFENPIEFDGKTDIYTSLNPNTPTYDDVDTTQKITLPQQIQVGLTYEWIPDRFMTAFSYEYTMNEVIEADAPVFDSAFVAANPLFAAANISNPLHYRNGHTLHGGAEYTFHLHAQNKLRLGAGLAYDRAVTRSSNPNPVIPPSESYLGGTLGLTYEMLHHIFGMSLAYGRYSDNTSAAELDPELQLKKTAFPGKYGIETFNVAWDYQYRF